MERERTYGTEEAFGSLERGPKDKKFNTLATQSRDYEMKQKKDFVRIPNHEDLNNIVVGL